MRDSNDSEPVEILLVEDNPGDVRLTVEALKAMKVRNRLSVVRDGVEAMAYLRHEGSFQDAPRPHLILLDLNMPRMDGRQLLAKIKDDPDLRRIPVVILTTSAAEQDIVKSYSLHANAYITKPVDFPGLVEVVKSVEDFWFAVVTLPRG